MMRGMLRKSAVALIFTLCVASSGRSNEDEVAPEINALWNDGNGFGIWNYFDRTSCASTPYNKLPFLVVGSSGSRENFQDGEFNQATTHTCLFFDSAHGMFLCKNWKVTYHFDRMKNEYFGNYSATIDNEEKISGKYRAEYCKQANKE